MLPGNRSQGMRGYADTGKQQRKEPVELIGGQSPSSSGPARTRASGNRLFQNAMGTAPARSTAPVPKRNVNDAPIELLAPEPKKPVASAPPPPVVVSRPVTQEQPSTNASFGIKGAGNPQMKVLIEGLVQGTTAVDVEVRSSASREDHVLIMLVPCSLHSSNTSTSSRPLWLLPPVRRASLQNLPWKTERLLNKWFKSSMASLQMAIP